MPLTPFQKEVLAIIVENRSEERHFAGGLVLNASEQSARFSHDFDILHHAFEEVRLASETDPNSFREPGYEIGDRSNTWDPPPLEISQQGRACRRAHRSCG